MQKWRNPTDEHTVLLSLVIILSINIGGYNLITFVMYKLLSAFGSIFGPPIRVWQVGFVSGILLNTVAGSNGIILYFNSTEYRHVFKKEFQAFKAYFGHKNAVQTIGTNQVRSANPNNKMNKIRSSQQRNVHTINLNR